VLGESCTTNNDCTATQCGEDGMIACQHPDGEGIITGNGLCTCQDAKGNTIYIII